MISSVYSPVAQFVSTTSTSTSASERNGRAIRKVFRKPSVKVQPWNVEHCTIILRSSDGSVREVSGFEVRRGEVSKRFVNREGVERFISQN
jgi:predicted trehalose synthase